MDAAPPAPPNKRPKGRLVKVDRTDEKAVARTRAIIRLLYDVHKNSRGAPLHQVRKNKRFRELETVFAYYWRGIELPDDDAGRDCLYIAACHIWHLGRKCGPVAAIEAWALRWAPWCGADELAALIKRVEVNPRKWKADPLGVELRLPFELRQALGITTIGSFDLDKDGRKMRRAQISKERSAARRRKNGAISRSEYLARAEYQTKPWQALGISERTYYRRRKNARETQTGKGPNAAKVGDTLVSSDFCQCESHVSRPWLELGISRATYYRRHACFAVVVQLQARSFAAAYSRSVLVCVPSAQ
jgi:hypothetical protein